PKTGLRSRSSELIGCEISIVRLPPVRRVGARAPRFCPARPRAAPRSAGTAPRRAPRGSSAPPGRRRPAPGARRSAPARPAPARRSPRSQRARSEPAARDLHVERRPRDRRLTDELVAGADDRVTALQRRARRERAEARVGVLEACAAALEREERRAT